MSDSQRGRALQYLLGELPEPEAVQFEEEYFNDDELFEETSALENELIDSFVRGELSEAERQQFEKGYLISPARRANVEFSRVLATHLSALNPGNTKENTAGKREPIPIWSSQNGPTVHLAWVAAILIAIASLAWMTIVNQRLRNDLDSLRAQQTESQKQVQTLSQQIASLNSQLLAITATAQQETPGTNLISMILIPGVGRSPGDLPKLTIGQGTPLVQFRLFMEHDDYLSYRVSIENADGKQAWEKTGLKSQAGKQGGKIIAVKIPSSIFKGSDYLVKLDGLTPEGKFEEAEDYRFQVVRR